MAAVAGNSKLFGWISGLGMLSKAGSSCESELNGVCVLFFLFNGVVFFLGLFQAGTSVLDLDTKLWKEGNVWKKKDEHKYESPSKQETSQLSICACLDWIQQSSLFSARIYDRRVATKLAGCASRQLVLPIIWPSKYPKEMVILIVLNYGVNQLCKGTWSV